MREPFIIFRRKDGAKGGRMYYADFWDPAAPPNGGYINRTSASRLLRAIEAPETLDPCKKADARRIVELWLQTHTPSSGALLLPYLEGFWLQGGEYAQRVKVDTQRTVSPAYLYNSRKNVKNHFRPFLEEQGRASLQISHVTPRILSEYKVYLSRKGLAPATINSAIKSVFVPINDFWRQAGAPDRSPARLVPYAAAEAPERDILSIAEAAKVFALPGLAQRDRLLLQLAAFAGLRVSEACALRPERLTLEGFEGPSGRLEYYTVAIVEQAGGRRPKAGSAGEATIPFTLGRELLYFYEASTWKQGWIFDGKTRGTCLQKREAELVSNGAITKALGISEEERIQRGLTFHAWRHWYVSYIRGATDKELAKKLARHRSDRMTERYTHLTEEERRRSAQAEVEILDQIRLLSA